MTEYINDRLTRVCVFHLSRHDVAQDLEDENGEEIQ